MHSDSYEPHYYPDPHFPVIFHYDVLEKDFLFPPHWHENPEILYFIRGKGHLLINHTQEIFFQPGEVAVVPTSALHQVFADDPEIGYYCLIVDKNFCAEHGLDLEESYFQPQINSKALNARLDHIIEEFNGQTACCRTEILASILSALVYLARNYPAAEPPRLSKTQAAKLDMVKQAFLYMEQHYSGRFSMEELAEAAGFSKFYFCHTFKEVTGMPPGAYLNFVRCRHAKELLSAGRCSVGQAAEQCGFENLSYFSKVYQKYIGESPSKTAKKR